MIGRAAETDILLDERGRGGEKAQKKIRPASAWRIKTDYIIHIIHILLYCIIYIKIPSRKSRIIYVHAFLRKIIISSQHFFPFSDSNPFRLKTNIRFRENKQRVDTCVFILFREIPLDHIIINYSVRLEFR